MIYLVRHGQTNWNKEGRIQGVVDIPLNTIGIKQAMDKRRLFENHHFTNIYTSPLSRAKQTAEIISSKAKVDNFEISDDLIEYNFGERDGLTFEEDARRFQRDMAKGEKPDYGEEDEKHFIERLSRILVKAAQQEGNVMIVSHGAVLSTLIDMLLPPEQQGQNFLSNSSVCAIDNRWNDEGNLVLTFQGANLSEDELDKLLTEND